MQRYMGHRKDVRNFAEGVASGTGCTFSDTEVHYALWWPSPHVVFLLVVLRLLEWDLGPMNKVSM